MIPKVKPKKNKKYIPNLNKGNWNMFGKRMKTSVTNALNRKK